jgi:hypothetical protein
MKISMVSPDIYMPADFCGEKGYYPTLLKMAIDKRMIRG